MGTAYSIGMSTNKPYSIQAIESKLLASMVQNDSVRVLVRLSVPAKAKLSASQVRGKLVR